MTRYSILDLAPIVQGGDAAQAFRNSLDLARHAEAAGYHRYWIAEHHNIPGVASAATAVLIAHVAAGTRSIRVGAGGIMLPNHAPLAIAEQFGTLESLHPGRIDLGLGRAPGGDPLTARALRRGLDSNGDTFGRDLAELRGYFQPAAPGQPLRAVPGAGLNVPIYILGSSDFGAHLAARLGLPFAFASHFAPDYLLAALDIYRRNFQPSAVLDRPYAIVGANVIAAGTDAEAQRLFTSLQQAFLGIIRGQRTELLPPVDDIEEIWEPHEAAHVAQMTRCSAIGSPETIRRTLATILEQTNADEIITTAQIHDHPARLQSLEIAAKVLDSLIST